MRITLNRSQANGLFNLITYLLVTFPYRCRSEQIHDLIIRQIWVKLRSKIESRKTYPSYSITLSELEALTFEEWMINMSISIPSGMYRYELNEVLRITALINEEYG